MGNSCIYGFDRKRTFKVGYMAGNKRSSQGYRGYDKKVMDYRGSLPAKNKWDQFYCVVFFRQEGQAFESTHFP